MAATTKLLHLRPLRHHHPLLRFSSSSSDDPPPSNPSSLSSYFSEVKASLKSHPPKPSQNPQDSSDPPPKIQSVSEIHKDLSQFRIKPVSFQDMYKKNLENKVGEENKSKGFEFGSIRESLKNMKSQNLGGERKGGLGSFTSFNTALNARLGERKGVETEELPGNVFGRELAGEVGVGDGLEGEFYKAYGVKDLGKKLAELRPEMNGEGEGDERNWFSLEELSERLRKLRVIDEKEMQAGPKSPFKDIRQSLIKIVKSDMDKKNNMNVQRIDMLTNVVGEQDFMLLAPKENLVEKYFHPDNMSSAEKLKIELAKVREEFKMSESDCGSARVQVALLTTKIKHLSSVLHKKDKHSRKGLQGMAQQRKKLLKYLRRTDWDSYCMVLSKLGLRDNPEYKS